MKDKEKIALFIDADNAPAAKIDVILSELARYGVVNIRKAYGNWKSDNLKSWEAVLHEYAIQPIQQFDITKGKNATDIAIVIDVMDTLHTKSVDVICIASSDGDFTPLITRILAEGKLAIGIGEKKAASPFVNSCSKFIYLDAKPEKAQKTSIIEPIINAREVKVKQDKALHSVLLESVIACAEQGAWARLGAIGTYLKEKQYPWKQHNFGKLVDLCYAVGLFESRKTQGSVVWFKAKSIDNQRKKA